MGLVFNQVKHEVEVIFCKFYFFCEISCGFDYLCLFYFLPCTLMVGFKPELSIVFNHSPVVLWSNQGLIGVNSQALEHFIIDVHAVRVFRLIQSEPVRYVLSRSVSQLNTASEPRLIDHSWQSIELD